MRLIVSKINQVKSKLMVCYKNDNQSIKAKVKLDEELLVDLHTQGA